MGTIIHSIKKNLLKNIYVYVLLGIVCVLVGRNISPDTYLAGWDNLMTEFSPFLGVKRAFFGVWQEYQGMGLLAGMAHAADLMRALFVWVLSFIIPTNLIRYYVQGIYLAIGAVGIYFLLEKRTSKLAAFIGALFYLLNLGTVQIMYIPYEPFSAFFAFLPWQLTIFFDILHESKLNKKKLIQFIIINFLATTYAYVQTLFIVYSLIIGLASCVILLREHSVKTVKLLILLGVMTLTINSFWLLPQIYFVKTSSSVVQLAKSNQLSTEDTVYQNLEKGTVANFISMKGFYFDLYNSNNQQLFAPWKDHFSSHTYLTVVLSLFICLFVLGIIASGLKHLELAIVFPLLLIALLSNTPVISYLGTLVRQNSIINQLFRSPFTKFIIPYSLIASFFIACGVQILFIQLKKVKYAPYGISILFILLIVWYSLPAFAGYYFSPNMRGPIPQSYIKAMSYFKMQDKHKRIAQLPDYTYWGWFRYKWGYDGSGFLWYGVEQPIISRTFDVWSRESENYYWEIKQAIESEDPNLFQRVANKYNVSYFLLDKSLLPITSSAKGMQYDRLERLMPQMPGIHRIEEWDNLVLFENLDVVDVRNFISVTSVAQSIGPVIKQTNLDTAFIASGGYITNANILENEIIHPFLNLMSQTRQNNPDWKISENTSEYIVESLYKLDYSKYDIVFPSKTFNQTFYTEQGLTSRGGTINWYITPSGHFAVRVPKIKLKSYTPAETEIVNCGNIDGQIVSEGTQFIDITTTNGAHACFGYTDATLDQKYGYLIDLNQELVQGRGLLFYVLDLTKKESVIEERITDSDTHFILPPRYGRGLGYNFSFQQNSYTDIPSENILTSLNVYAFPFSEVRNIQFVKKNIAIDPIVVIPHESEAVNYYKYKVKLEPDRAPRQITLYQSFHQGWKAYEVNADSLIQNNLPFLFGAEVKDHFLVNNWANGWKLKSSETNIVIIFWPQYLEYLGLILLGLTIGRIILLRQQSEK